MNKQITILGAGSSGMSTAAYLTLCGYRVILCDTEEQSSDFTTIRNQGGIILRGGSGKTGCSMPWKLTNDFSEALYDTDCVLICCSSSRHEEMSKLCAQSAQDKHIFLLSPGNFGSFRFRRELDAAGKKGAAVAELSGNLWACRRTAPGEVLIAMPLKTGTIAALPAVDTKRVIDAFKNILSLKPGKNVLEVSLNSPNVISHVSGAVLNATTLEQKGASFAFFQDGLSESVIHCFCSLEKERNAVIERLGFEVYGESSESLMRKLKDNTGGATLSLFRALDGPSSFSHRYVSEDAACGVSMLVSLGRQYGVMTPLTQSFLTIAGTINCTDYMQNGYTLENLGLAGLTADELVARL